MELSNTPHSKPFHFRGTQNNDSIFSRRNRTTTTNPIFPRRSFIMPIDS